MDSSFQQTSVIGRGGIDRDDGPVQHDRDLARLPASDKGAHKGGAHGPVPPPCEVKNRKNLIKIK